MASLRKIKKQAERAGVRRNLKEKDKIKRHKIAKKEKAKKAVFREVSDYLGFNKFKKSKRK